MNFDTLILGSDESSLSTASNIINNGGIVAFPTETVYGLGGNALNKESILKIYKAKGRPSDNPLIVHIGDISMLYDLVTDVPLKAQLLIDAFFPGPLTLILHKSPIIPDEITAFKNTVGIRMPSNKIARDFINKSGVPIGAPSANISGKPSTTRFSHVKDDLYGKIDAIIKDEESAFGLESTIIDMTTNIPTLLRPGSITVSMIENVIGKIQISSYITDNLFLESSVTPIAPGMKYKHYSPNAEIIIFKGDFETAVEEINRLILINDTLNIGILTNDEYKNKFVGENINVISLGNNIAEIGKNLFNSLREFDKLNVDIIYSLYFDENEAGLAVMNRLKKAAGFNITTL